MCIRDSINTKCIIFTLSLSPLGVINELRIEVRTMVPNESVCLWGGDPSGSSVSIQSERFLLYNTGSEILPAVLTVTVYDGEVPGNKIYMTEVMYNPTKSGANYEWIEIYNPTNYALDLNEFKISDRNESDYLKRNADDIITIPAGAVGIIVVNETFFRENILVSVNENAYIFEVEDSAIGKSLDIEDEIIVKYGANERKVAYNYETDGAFRNGNSLNISCIECEEFIEGEISPGTYET